MSLSATNQEIHLRLATPPPRMFERLSDASLKADPSNGVRRRRTLIMLVARRPNVRSYSPHANPPGSTPCFQGNWKALLFHSICDRW
jgi:hypothetical protein